MKSKPFRSPWGINKTRMERRSNRFRFLDGRPRKSPMSMRYFDRSLNRFSEHWSK